MENKYFLGFRPFQLNLTTMRFRCPTCLHFGAKLAPKIGKNHLICPSKTHRFFASILALIFMRFGLHLGTQVAAMLASCGPQNAPKTHQKSKTNGLGPHDAPKIDFSWIFDGFLVDVWSIWDWSLIDFLQENGVARWGVHFVNKLSSQHKLIQGKPIHKHSSNLAPCGKALAYQIPGVDKALINPKTIHQPPLTTSPLPPPQAVQQLHKSSNTRPELQSRNSTRKCL